MQYRPEIDGLRALAVVPVLFFHAGFAWCAGGFVGVDVFFVISGYLITSILYQDMEQGRFSMMRFYERRARRILPALLLVSLACIPFAWAWMLPNELIDFSESLIGVATFTSNILFWKESGYFADPAELKPLLHTWSLAVEEQYYIIFPPLLLLLHRHLRRHLFAVIAAGTLASLALADYASTTHRIANYYFLPTRAWELGAGVLAALYRYHHPKDRLAPIWRELLGLTGLGLIVYTLVSFDEQMPFPSLWALLPIVGTVLVILFADGGTVSARILGWRLLVGIGLISYSSYLWHQPLFAFARIRLFEGVPESVYWLLIAATFLLSWLSWITVETPARKGWKGGRTRVLSAAAVSLAGLAVIGTLGLWGEGLPQRPHLADAMRFMEARYDTSPFFDQCHDPESFETTCTLGGKPAEQDAAERTDPILVWGDSHGVELAWQFAERLEPYGIPVRQITFNGCQPSLSVREVWHDHGCENKTRAAFDYMVQLAPGATVIIVARWPAYIEGSLFDNGEGGVETGMGFPFMPVDWNGGTNTERIGRLAIAIADTIEALAQHGHQVVLVYPIPEVGFSVPEYLSRRALFGIHSQPLSTSYQIFLERQRHSYAALDGIPDSENLLRIYPAELFCNTRLAGRCAAELDGEPLYRDDDHLNKSTGSRMLMDLIQRQMQAKGWWPQAPD